MITHILNQSKNPLLIKSSGSIGCIIILLICFFEYSNAQQKKPIPKLKDIQEEINEILDVLDNYQISKEEQITVYAKDIVHMAPNHQVITNKKDLLAYLNQQKEYGYAIMEHQIVTLSQHDDIILMRGKVIGKFYPNGEKEPTDFETKNLFVFKRIKEKLKIWKVIYNMTPSN